MVSEPYAGHEPNIDRSPHQNEILTRVGPGAPAGEYFRRFWLPVALTDQVKDLPLALKILGEELVLFRDQSGHLGLLHAHCSHRGTSLEFGIISQSGIRCCYHGWLYDIDGTILETPGEPANSRIAGHIFHGAYPLREHGGLIFAYMGPPDERPAFPMLDSIDQPDDEIVPYSIHSPCNWLQITENAMDPFHSVFLHARVTGAQFQDLAAFSELPIPKWHDRDFPGFFYTNPRRVGDYVWVRLHDYFLPTLVQNGSLFEDAKQSKYFGRGGLTRWIVPIDDTNSMMIAWRHFNDRDDPEYHGNRDEIGYESIDFYGQTKDRPYEMRQRNPGDYDAWVSQGPVNDHNREHLGVTDKGVGLLRRKLLDEVGKLEAGVKPAQPYAAAGEHIHTYAGDVVLKVPKSNDDRALVAAVADRVAEVMVSADPYAGEERVDYLKRSMKALEDGF